MPASRDGFRSAFSRHAGSRVRRGLLLEGAALVFCVAASAACADPPLSQEPPHGAQTQTFDAGASTLEPKISITYQALGDAGSAAEDRFAGFYNGTTQVGCRAKVESASKAPVDMPPGCLNLDWHVHASRNGAVTAKRDGERVEFDIPVKFEGNGGFRGSLAKALAMNNKEVNGTFVVKVSGALKPGKDYCPKLDHPYAHFDWGQAPQVDFVPKTCLGPACIGPWKLPVGAMMTGSINHSVESQVNDINNKIPCNQIRDALNKVWKPWSFPVTIPGSPTFYANLTPKQLAVPGVTATDTGIDVVARLEAATGISTEQMPQPANAELPENSGVAVEPGKFSLEVPLAVPYGVLASFPSGKFVNQPIRANGVAIMPVSVAMFPSNGKLAIGVTIRADWPPKLKGQPLKGQTATVWYTAQPAIADDGHLIRLDNLTMTQKSESPLWAEGAAIEQLPKAIAGTYSYDFATQLRIAKDSLHGLLSDPKNTGGATVSTANDTLKLERIALLPNAFVVEGAFNADVSVALGELKQQANAVP